MVNLIFYLGFKLSSIEIQSNSVGKCYASWFQNYVNVVLLHTYRVELLLRLLETGLSFMSNNYDSGF